ncbi:conserved membrane hypothetical protein [Candidatus Methylobacter favarea]|uniref:Uncharacterized protein n=1 Tax=Candidatus Methylobacter favarea TaxID=2707345 RepID=A0A8S0WZI6_9GAMM|nr:hypothetical protein [Candidatus Methylobacter favarea]CAA9890205.1 conserved membrane hypothetical protein [Candidatus Methylobacter favarea]
MNIKQWLQVEYLPLPLIALMALTRFHHFGDVLHLPDASLAVFFLAGFYRKKFFFVFLLAMAALIDYIAIKNGVSDWCVSPAYVFLIPTYAVMWSAGRYCSTFKALKISELATSMSLIMLATTAAFIISNISFYLFSGRFDDLSLLEYLARVALYYPSYLSAALIYAGAGLAVIKIIYALPALTRRHKAG